ncbi:MAG TPA: efflux RND transporter periplasmic adaptor subunit [bacterium]|nr:efflux RND transporter periplasmic adaptor subunit [bacterium]
MIAFPPIACRHDFLPLFLAVLLAISGCSRTAEQAEDEHHDEAGHEPHESHDGDPGGEERHVRLTPQAITASGIVLLEAGPQELEITLDLPGEVLANADRLAHIVPRFPGVAREVRKSLGSSVTKGEVLAVIESNESLSLYDVTSLMGGTIVEKHITLGEFVRDDSDIFVIADLSTVWVNITVYPGQLDRVRPGQEAHVLAVGGEQEALARIDYVGPVLGEATRSATARAVLPNPARQWRPGMFVTARIVTARETVPLAVPDQAMVQLEGRPCIFVEAANEFHPRPIEPGRTDGQWTEVRSGIETGERFVSEGAFILKSELLKSAAGHEH